MKLDPEILSIVAVAAAGVAVISLAFAMRSTAKVRRLRRALRVIQASRGTEEVTLDDAEDVLRTITDVGKRVDDLEIVARLAVQHVGLVKFDAFEDMGGHLSFAAAMLDAEGDGFVLTSINGRQDARIYAKPIERGQSVSHLSDEEQEAIRRAISSHHRTV